MENKDLITKAIRYIQENPEENLSLQSIADSAGFSLAYFDTIFRRHTGYSAVEYSRVYKLTRAAHALRRHPEVNVIDIALDYGYSSPETFARAFRSFYGISPTEYRDAFADEALGWKALSSRIAVGRFARAFPEMKPVCADAVIDLAFTQNPLLYAEDLIEFTVSDAQAFSLDDPEDPHSAVIASDYDDAEPFLNLLCPSEADAVRYLDLLTRLGSLRFELHKDPAVEWEAFDRAAASAGFVCRRTLDLIYPEKTVEVPEVPGMSVRELTADDLPLVREFQRKGGCGSQHVKALELRFQGIANPGERAFGLFRDGALAGLATPVLDVVRDLKKYDVGEVFVLDGVGDAGLELLWKSVIAACLADQCLFGSAGTDEEMCAFCQRIGMQPVAERVICEKR